MNLQSVVDLFLFNRTFSDPTNHATGLRPEVHATLPAVPSCCPFYVTLGLQQDGSYILQTNLGHSDRLQPIQDDVARDDEGGDRYHLGHISNHSRWIIGRGKNCALRMPLPAISRHHAALCYDAHRGFYIMDMGSRNGTYLNQHRLAPFEIRFLNHGDQVRLSHQTIQMSIHNEA